MKSFASIWFLVILLILPAHIFAESEDTYMVYASEEELSEIIENYGSVVTDFEEIPLMEMKLSDSEKADIRKQFASVQIYPNREYEIAADAASPTFTLTNSAPSQSTPFTGKGVRVAVLDTGIDTEHPDIAVKGGTCTAKECSIGVPYDDNFGHGTHVAGIIAAKKDGNGMVGMAPNVELYAIKSMNSEGVGTTSQVTEGVKWAIQNNIQILNLSISISFYDRPLELMLQEAFNQGMIIVSAAGNEGGSSGQDTITYPAKFSSVIAVGALKNDLSREVNSSVGPTLEVTAPGKDVRSLYPQELDVWDDKQDGYRALTGTSMAAPHVVGVLALYKEQHPNMSNVKLREVLQTTAKDLGKAGRDELYGFGVAQYTKSITTVPFIETTVSKGRIEMILKNKTLASNWTLHENGTELKQVENGKWITYRTKGTHAFTFDYTDAKAANKSDSLSTTVEQPNFPDVTSANWFAPHISYLFSNNMMSGYKDGSFKPFKNITRGEAVILLGRARGWDGTQRETKFNDVGQGNSASGYIQSAFELGVISGFSDGNFKPYQAVTRAEMAILLYKAYGFDYDSTKSMPFKDVTTNMASYESIHAITQQGITTGISSNAYGPSNFMNRHAFAVFLARTESPTQFK